ncbi:MAG: hypothetical protein EA384_16945 [Spirochaetaceae bacterium]|nr:MAG: hypothetical protein EA384_16945 [Spirochaetaceae bacterium]
MACAVLALILAAGAGAQEQERVRSPWYFGFGVGAFFDATWVTDGAEITWDDLYKRADTDGVSFKGGGKRGEPPIGVNFRVGRTLSSRVLLGVDLTFIGQEGISDGQEIATEITNLFGMLTLFPQQKGLFIRLGGGLSSFSIVEVMGPITDEFMGYDGSAKHEYEYDGYGGLAGIGYAFWLGRRINLTLNVDHSRQYYYGYDKGPDESRFTMVYLGFDWY